MTTPTCGNCRFYRSRDKDRGKCRRYPPTVIAGGFAVRSDWPETDGCDWCGEHQPKDREVKR